MSLDGLLQALEENPDLEASTETLLPFVDGPEFFEGFIRKTGNFQFKSLLYQKEGSLLNVIEMRKDFFRDFVKSKFSTLDSIEYSFALASALGVKVSRFAIAKALVERGFVSPELPDGHPIGKSQGSWYVNPEVVGEEQVERNLRKYVRDNYKTLENIERDEALASALGVKVSRFAIAKALVERGFVSPELPDGHSIGGKGARTSWYVNPEVVGEEQFERNLRKYVEDRYHTLDKIKQDKALASVLSVRNTQSNIANALIERGFMSPELPDGHSITRSSWYINPEVVGEEQADENVKKYIRATYRTLDDVRGDNRLSTYVGLKGKYRKRGLLAKILVERGLMSGELPDGHSIGGKGARTSWYVNPEVVGEEQAERNLRKYIKFEISSLDNLKKERALASALGISGRNRNVIAKTLVERGFMSPELPDGHSISKGPNLSFYIDPKIVGEEQAERNLRKYVQATYSNLDTLRQNHALSSALGIEIDKKYSTSFLAKTIIERGFMSPELPDGHLISKTGGLSWYVNPEVVGEEQFERNLRKYVQTTFRTSNDVKQHYGLATLLGVENKINAITNELVRRGYLKDGGFRSWSNNSLPEQFRQKTVTRKPKKKIKEIGAYTQPKEFHSTKFVKGEAFEQLVGLFLAYANPEELVVPQFCLDVRESYFGTRVDFRVGNSLYEVKWGHATENIMETSAKHMRLVEEGHQGLDYRIIRLERNVDGIEIDVPYRMFDSFTESSEVGQDFRTLADLLRRSSEDWNNVREVEFLTHFRDFIYNVVDTANSKKGEERKKYVREKLVALVSLKGKKDELDAYMRENTDKYFAPLEAHLELEGQIYRGFIVPKQLQEEQSHRYSTIFYFGDIEFVNELDRDIAVMIECSADVRRIERVLKNPKRLQTNPLFKVNDKLSISTNGHPNAVRVNSLDELKGILSFENDMYEFGREYITTHGNMC